MGKALLAAMIIAAGVFGVLLLFNHSPNSNIVPVPVNLSPTPRPYHLVVATGSATPVLSITPSSVPVVNTVANPVATSAAITTSKGTILLTLFLNNAPIAVTNFIKKAQSGFYNGLTFHRVEDWVIQGGDPKGDGTGGQDMQTELNNKPFVAGSLGVAAHQGPDGKNINNDAQFFITKTDASWLNGQYTNFGMVTSGMDVVNKIAIGDKILGISIK